MTEPLFDEQYDEEDEAADDALFTVMRFQVLSAALTPGVGKKISDAYAFAWDAGVYPISDDGAPWHIPFSKHFSVTKEMMSDLTRFLDDNWLAKTVPTFYELESHYKIRRGDTEWNRGALICACRYFFLEELFDKEFWSRLITPMEHPAEAAHIISKYDRDEDLFLL